MSTFQTVMYDLGCLVVAIWLGLLAFGICWGLADWLDAREQRREEL